MLSFVAVCYSTAWAVAVVSWLPLKTSLFSRSRELFWVGEITPILAFRTECWLAALVIFDPFASWMDFAT